MQIQQKHILHFFKTERNSMVRKQLAIFAKMEIPFENL